MRVGESRQVNGRKEQINERERWILCTCLHIVFAAAAAIEMCSVYVYGLIKVYLISITPVR